ncbi:hypothetical protein F5Y08DRAFT_144159 [Xylaria arbuscula]|nr:hypothetical protein F5Y08DRAFT_144159 [Xylaria arbuscula]
MTDVARDLSHEDFESIASAATASWLAQRASTPNSSNQPLAIPSTAPQRGTSPPAPELAPPPSSAPVLPPAPSDYTSASTTSVSSPEDSGAQTNGDASIHSDITAWQSAIQSLPVQFANAKLPEHPLSLSLMNQPSLRPVEWNPYRQQGGFVPRTAHDYSSLMIYVSGQVNPNPCRKCRLRNGPFAQCVVSPPVVLANSALRHACANCTYQCQYNKCTNEPISEQERLRVELLRSVLRAKPLTPRQPMTRQPTAREKADRPAGKKSNSRRQSKQQHRSQQQARAVSQDNQPGPSSSGVALGLAANLVPFEEKLQYIRASSPQSRRRVAAETLQWQAAIATIEAEAPPPTPDIPIPRPAAEPIPNHHSRTLPGGFTSPHSTPASSLPTLMHGFAPNSPPSVRNTNYNTGNSFDAMDEDESEDEQESSYGEPTWTAPDNLASIIKAPR